ncbi:hypothetical protein TorRG33x02_194460 [Trema orientale]|uniref:Uncharacterized protein n=1 Tax=Trema orientale TaxID=63057 RepID=A0A2P5EGU2_TREOI|nr:hypothetical protein TorRG33x02_194460 [Trema orientale]
MAVSFTNFSWWWLGGKENKEPVSNGSSINSSFECGFGLREPETVHFPSVKGKKVASSTGKVKGKWHTEERRMDKECDFVMVPSDGDSLSGLESDGSDMSIGWMEPHGPGFQSEDESDNGFAVLVPCYSPGCKELVEDSDNAILSAIKNLPIEFSPDCKNYMEQVLYSLQSFGA